MTTTADVSNSTETTTSNASDRKAFTVALPKHLIIRFRMICAAQDRSMSDTAEEALAAWVALHFEAALKAAAE